MNDKEWFRELYINKEDEISVAVDMIFRKLRIRTYDDIYEIDLKYFKKIYKQMKELGWLDE